MADEFDDLSELQLESAVAPPPNSFRPRLSDSAASDLNALLSPAGAALFGVPPAPIAVKRTAAPPASTGGGIYRPPDTCLACFTARCSSAVAEFDAVWFYYDELTETERNIRVAVSDEANSDGRRSGAGDAHALFGITPLLQLIVYYAIHEFPRTIGNAFESITKLTTRTADVPYLRAPAGILPITTHAGGRYWFVVDSGEHVLRVFDSTNRAFATIIHSQADSEYGVTTSARVGSAAGGSFSASPFRQPVSICADPLTRGVYYVTDRNTIRELKATNDNADPPQWAFTVRVIAGGGEYAVDSGAADGYGVNARFDRLSGILACTTPAVVRPGLIRVANAKPKSAFGTTLFVADTQNNRVVAVDVTTTTAWTVAGVEPAGGSLLKLLAGSNAAASASAPTAAPGSSAAAASSDTAIVTLRRPSGLVWDCGAGVTPQTGIWIAGRTNVVRYDRITGATKSIDMKLRGCGTPIAPAGIECCPNGMLLVACDVTNCVYRVNPTSGAIDHLIGERFVLPSAVQQAVAAEVKERAAAVVDDWDDSDEYDPSQSLASRAPQRPAPPAPVAPLQAVAPPNPDDYTQRFKSPSSLRLLPGASDDDAWTLLISDSNRAIRRVALPTALTLQSLYAPKSK